CEPPYPRLLQGMMEVFLPVALDGIRSDWGRARPDQVLYLEAPADPRQPYVVRSTTNAHAEPRTMTAERVHSLLRSWEQTRERRHSDPPRLARARDGHDRER